MAFGESCHLCTRRMSRIDLSCVLQVNQAVVAALADAVEDVRVLREPEAAGFGALGGVLHPERVDRIHTVARNRRVWTAA